MACLEMAGGYRGSGRHRHRQPDNQPSHESLLSAADRSDFGELFFFSLLPSRSHPGKRRDQKQRGLELASASSVM